MKMLDVSASLFFALAIAFACAKSPKEGAKTAERPAPTAHMPESDHSDTEELPALSQGISRSDVTVHQAVVCRSVEDRTPVGAGEVFPADVGRVYFFTQLGVTDGEEASVKHIWMYKGQKIVSVTLPVMGSRWRTYSSKAINPSWTGPWHVNVVDAETSAVIKSIAFTIE